MKFEIKPHNISAKNAQAFIGGALTTGGQWEKMWRVRMQKYCSGK